MDYSAEMSKKKNDYLLRLTSEIHEGAKKAESLSSASIYRVPKELHKLNESAYTPRLIAIGPLHRNDPHLQTPMQYVKMSYTKNLLCRMSEKMEGQETAEQKELTVLRDCMAAMKTSLDDAKKCYQEEVKLDEKMMLVDACFILEYLYRIRLYRCGSNSKGLEEDPIFGNDLICHTLQHDLLLLENQIPFVVLERLFPLTLAQIPQENLSPQEELSLADYVVLPIVAHMMHPAEENSTNSTGSAKTSCWPRDCVLWVSADKMNNFKPEESVSSRNASYYHILHKLHDDFLPSVAADQERVLHRSMPSASELVYSGVKFVSRTGNDLFKVNFTEPTGPFWWFRSARFDIPSLNIQKWTEPILLNFITLEQCCPGISQHFTSYVILMDKLLKSDIDVQVLKTAGVVNDIDWLGVDEDVTDLFNKLCKEVGMAGKEILFSGTYRRATRYSKLYWPKNMADLRRQYFSSPWKFIAFCLGFVYFGFTIAQLIVSICIK